MSSTRSLPRTLVLSVLAINLGAGGSAAAQTPSAAGPAFAAPAETSPGDWRHAAPGVAHRIAPAEMPAPYSTASSGNGPQIVKRPANASLSAPP